MLQRGQPQGIGASSMQVLAAGLHACLRQAAAAAGGWWHGRSSRSAMHCLRRQAALCGKPRAGLKQTGVGAADDACS